MNERATIPAIEERIGAAGDMWRGLPREAQRRVAGWALWMVVLTMLFARPLGRLLVRVLESELHSYIVIVPLVTAYLVYLRRPQASCRTSVAAAALLAAAGFALVAARAAYDADLSTNDSLAVAALAYVSLAGTGAFLFMGSQWIRQVAFPLAFLVFIVPLPDAVVSALEWASVLASAEVAAWMFAATGTPLLRDGLFFQLPGIVIQVAQECSGIRSSWVLFISSLLASHLFLTSPWRRIVLVVFVIPLAIVRNGFRILVIGLLCVHIGPHMIESVIHRHGGPLFFMLSLIPLFVLLAWLQRNEQDAKHG